MKSIHPFYFLISLSIGMFIVYLSTPLPEIIIQYPTPQNAGKILYNHDDQCYVYRANKVSCPTNPDEITTLPYQSYKNEEKNNINPLINIYNNVMKNINTNTNTHTNTHTNTR